MNEQTPLDHHFSQDQATKKSVLKWKAIQAEEQIIVAQRILFFIVTLSAFSLWRTWALVSPEDQYLNIGVLVIYFVCALFTKKYPLICMSVALAIFLIPNLLTLIFAPHLIAQGWLWKGVLGIALSMGLYNAIKGSQVKKELEQYEI